MLFAIGASKQTWLQEHGIRGLILDSSNQPLGRTKRATIDIDNTTIVDGSGKQKEIEGRIKSSSSRMLPCDVLPPPNGQIIFDGQNHTRKLKRARYLRNAKMNSVPEISRFFGIVIRMFVESGEPHHAPHFHVYYQEETAVFTIDPIELAAGALPVRQRRLVEAWAEMHQPELSDAWQRLQAGRLPERILPLR